MKAEGSSYVTCVIQQFMRRARAWGGGGETAIMFVELSYHSSWQHHVASTIRATTRAHGCAKYFTP
eukprot:229030-Pleurochrysis_carterae.AAC.3